MASPDPDIPVSFRTARATANDRFHRQYSSAVAFGLIAAVAAHIALFELSPDLRAAMLDGDSDPMRMYDMPPPVEVPPPPEKIARPATPAVADVDVSPHLTIPRTDWDAHPELGPPPPVDRAGDRPPFIPFDVAPQLRNAAEVSRLLEREYPSALRQAGVGGRVELWIYVDEMGRVSEARVQTSSGHRGLDEAALRVAERMRFSPALNRDRRTAVWVSQAVGFRIR